MKNWLIFGLVAAVLASSLGPRLRAATENDEQTLIGVLKSGASPAEKDAACARLKRIGTARSVPALAALLRDEQLSHSARYALESMQCAEAEGALISALHSTTGLTRIGIIDSLESRGAVRALPSLAALLETSDAGTAVAAARAVGQFGGPDAAKALEHALRSSAGPVHQAVVDGLLRCANSLLVSGDHSRAKALFIKLDDKKETEFTQLAAFRGVLLASGNAALGPMIHAILHEPGPRQAAALQLVREVQAENATHQLAKLLPKVKPEVQTALVGALAQRGDPAAAPAIASLASGASLEVRPAILNALGTLGSAADIPMLSGFATTGNSVEQSAARRALANLRGNDVTDNLLAQLAISPPAVQVELARALGNRADRSAVPKLLALAQQPPDSVRRASLKALAELVEPDQVTSLVQMVLSAPDPTSRREAAEAISSAYQRFEARHRPVPTPPLVEALKIGSPEARIALLPICSGLVLPEIRVALRTALEDPNPKVRTAGIRALCDTIDPDLLDDLVSVARGTKQDNLGTLAFAGCVRITTQDESIRISREQQVTVLRTLLNAASTPEQKRMVLAGLAEVPTPETLSLVEPVLGDEPVKNEAARAAVKIGLALPTSQAQTTTAVLNKALATATDGSTRQALEAALKQVQASADYITDWQVAGPYREAGKDYAALFDMVFPPEMGDGAKASWKPLVAGSDPKRPWLIDLLKTFGGEQCVAYARTWVHSDQDCPVRLELGSDDGLKVWLNDKQVYALNTARPLQPGSDKVDLTLHSGWNLLLLKVTQNNQGWEFCARFLKPDGSHMDGLQCGASTRTDSGPAR